ncbi:copper resistance protein CopC/CopD [Thermomicrobium sp. CFH 73360]|uniref:copper resistance CopC/CopD family protein n=1 Tax=Thermomicrobium sp. CFH 73360 TaxID=2951987 RepID=UPI00207762A0|nr:copper resistance protein CopC [Thermomicrobium sp. CFH 73360]MCM8747482.1 copper resistance protein CopC/CopD [Thermomicrobium sp. CFH 73360]
MLQVMHGVKQHQRLLKALLLLTIIVGIGFPRKALAHAILLDAEPSPNALLDQVPQAVVLRFSEPVDPVGTGVIVIAPDGQRLQLDAARSRSRPDQTELRVPLEAFTAQGTYVVRYSVLGRDGHLITGRYVFSVGHPSAPQDHGDLSRWATFLGAWARLLHLLALALLFGAATLLLCAYRLKETRIVRAHLQIIARRGALVAAFASGLMLIAYAGNLTTLPNPEALRQLLATRPGAVWSGSFLLALFCYGILAAPLPAPVQLTLSIVSATALALSRAAVSHAAATDLPVLSIPVATVHTIGATILIGSSLALLPVLRATQGQTDQARAAAEQLIRRFALAAVPLAELVTLSGAYGLWTNVAAPEDLWNTPYGRTLLMKLAAVFAFTAVTGILTLRWLRQQRASLQLLRLKALFAFLILLAATILVMLPPTRSSLQPLPAASTALTLAQNAGPYLVTLRIDPAQPGTNRLSVKVTAPNGTTVDNARVTLELATSNGPRLVELQRSSPFYATTIDLTANLWSMAVYVLGPDTGEVPPARFQIPIPVPDTRALLDLTDKAMNRLQAAEERTELTSGGPVVKTVIQYRAPNQAAYSVLVPGRPTTETVIIGDRRYDRVAGGDWTMSPWPSSTPFRWPTFRYAQTAEDVRLLGIESIEGISCYKIAFYDPTSETHYRLWIGIDDFLVRRYEMMAPGHYMIGRFDRFDDPEIVLEVPPVDPARASGD